MTQTIRFSEQERAASITELRSVLTKGATIYTDRKSTRLNSSHLKLSRMPSSA